MASFSYALVPDGPKCLLISWEGISKKDFTVKYNDAILGVINSDVELQKGKEFQLPDESILHIQLKGIPRELCISHNGKPVIGSSNHPEERLKGAVSLLYLLAILNIVIGLLAEIFNISILKQLGLGYGSAVLGIIYGILAFFTKRRSLPALYIAFGIYILDTISMFAGMSQPGVNFSVAPFFVRYIFIYYLWKGIVGLKELKADK
ncbi:MAG: hypothetical protein WCO98_03000 [bacterium]